MVSIINEKLRQGGYELREMTAAGKKGKELTNAKMATLKEVYRILALCLGEPPHRLRGDIKVKTGISKSWPITRRNSSTKKSPRPTTVLPTIS